MNKKTEHVILFLGKQVIQHNI